MAIDVTNPDRFYLEYNNTVVGAYQKNGISQSGWFERDVGHLYVKETLFAVDVSSIPLGSTINSVVISLNMTARTLPSDPSTTPLYVAYQDQGAWSDTPTTSPVFDTFNVNDRWNDRARTMNVNTSNVPATGNFDITASANLVSLWQDFVDGVKNASDGVIIGMDTSTAVYLMQYDSVTITVDYTAGGGGINQGSWNLIL